MAPGAFDPEIDKRHRAPDQVEMGQIEFLVERGVDGPGRTGLAVGDVSGKAAPAALYAALVSGILRSHAPIEPGPAEMLSAAAMVRSTKSRTTAS